MTTQHTGNGACRLLHTLVSFTVQTFLDVHRIVTRRASTVVLARIYLLRAQGARGAAGQVQARWRRKVTRALPPARRPGSHIAEPTHRGPGAPWETLGAPRRGDAHPPAPPRSASRLVSVSVSRESGRKRSHSTPPSRDDGGAVGETTDYGLSRRFPDSGVDQPVHDVCTPVSPLPVLPTRDCDSRVVSTVCARRLRAVRPSASQLAAGLSQSHSRLWPGLFHHFMRSH